MDDVDLPLRVGVVLLVAGEIAEIAAGREDRMHSRRCGAYRMIFLALSSMRPEVPCSKASWSFIYRMRVILVDADENTPIKKMEGKGPQSE